MKIFRTPWFWWCVGAGLAALALIWAAYRFSWSATGFQDKRVWDWLQLLIVPAALALVALLFNQANTRTERQIARQRYDQDRQIALDKQREDLLQAYLDRMSELLLGKGLRGPKPDPEARNVAQVRTITTLSQLDARRIVYVFTFLREAGLQSPQSDRNIVSLRDLNLSKINLSRASLYKVNLSGANLSGADLSHADLSGANLSGANLSGADFSGANLSGADLSYNLGYTDLSDANLSDADLSDANLSEAILFQANLSYAKLRGADLRKVSVIPPPKSPYSKRPETRPTTFRAADLLLAKLGKADLCRADLREANLYSALLDETILRYADLSQANFGEDPFKMLLGGRSLPDVKPADLSGADLAYTNLLGARITEEQLKQARTLSGAQMPDGRIEPESADDFGEDTHSPIDGRIAD